MLARRLLPLLPLTLIGGCAEARHSPYYPDRLTVGVSSSYDRVADRWDKVLPSASLSWPLKPTPTAPIYPRTAAASQGTTHLPGEGEAP